MAGDATHSSAATTRVPLLQVQRRADLGIPLDNITIPVRGSDYSAGFDLFSAINSDPRGKIFHP